MKFVLEACDIFGFKEAGEANANQVALNVEIDREVGGRHADGA